MATMTAAEIITALNTSYQTFGYAGVGNNPTEITEANVASIAVLPESMRNNLFKELNRTISQRWFTNSINESAKGLFRFLIRNEGGYGFGITDRFVNLIQPTQYPETDAAAAADLVARKASPIDVHHFSDPYNPGGYYGATIDRQNMRKFCTPEGLVRYVEMIESNLFHSAEYGIMTEIAGMIKEAVEGGSMIVKTGFTLNTGDGLASTVEEMMTATDAFRQPTDLYNVGHKVMSTPEDADVVIVTTPSRWNRVRARLYADRYHLDQLYVNGKVIYAPEGTDLGTYTYTEGAETKTAPVQFVALDARGFVLEITTMDLRDFDVANRNYINQFLHVEGVKASAPLFVNCVGFAGEYGSFSG